MSLGKENEKKFLANLDSLAKLFDFNKIILSILEINFRRSTDLEEISNESRADLDGSS